MDDHRFDQLARALAMGTSSRRGLVRSAAALLGLGAGTRLTGADAATRCRRSGRPCGKDDHCCSGACLPPDGRGGRVCAKAPGERCSAGSECGGGHCVDDVCCDSACTGQCERCDASGKRGMCTPVLGAPARGRSACAGSGACAGACDGSHRMSCAYPGQGTTCGGASCTGGGDLERRVCDGQGGCATRTVDCGPYACANGICLSSCGGDGDCAGAAYCANGTCREDQADGAPCTSAAQCLSGFCADGACAQPIPNGEPAQSPGQCGSGFLADGVCCDRACTGQCEACNLGGGAGTCSYVTGAPAGGRAACGGGGTACAGTCTGSSAGCVYPVGAACATPVCQGETVVAATCRAGGSCQQSVQPCDPYRCANGACLTSCADDAGCLPGAFCTGGACVGDLPNGQPCVRAAQCQSGTCLAGTCGGSLLPLGATCGANDWCQSGNCAGGTCGCPSNEELCNGACIPATGCCTDGDCGSAGTCQRAVCDTATHTCTVAAVDADDRCASDACYDRACDGGQCVARGTIGCYGTLCEAPDKCDPVTGWTCREAVCNSPRPPFEYGTGTCFPGVGCVYPTR